MNKDKNGSQELLLELREILKEEGYSDQSNFELSEFGNGLCKYFDQLARLDCEKHYENEN